MTPIIVSVLVTPDCPHAQPALEMASRVARSMGEVVIERVTIATEEQANAQPSDGSPTLLVNGRDIEGKWGASVRGRLDSRPGGVPPDWKLEAALLRASPPAHVLFLCVANSARSQMAEGIVRRLVSGGVRVSSAGSKPSHVRPEAIQVLHEIGIDIGNAHCKSVHEVPTDDVDVVITLCADEVCPVYLGAALTIHWELPDPAAVVGDEEVRLDAFRGVRDELVRRLERVFATGE